MSDIFELIAERKIREAMDNGAFDDLPGKGQPLPQDDACGVPEELRMGYKILKNAGCLPQELELRREMLTLGDLLRSCPDEEEKTCPAPAPGPGFPALRDSGGEEPDQ